MKIVIVEIIKRTKKKNSTTITLGVEIRAL